MHPLLLPLRTSFHAHADLAEAEKMKAYVRGQFEFFGIKSSPRRMLSKEFMRLAGADNRIVSEALIRDLWAQPEREFQLAALDVLIKYKRYASYSYLSLYEWLIINKSWWDTVDLLASHLVGDIMLRFPEKKLETIRGYMTSGNLWLQRTGIIFQLKYKDKTDWELLQHNCLLCADSKAFFLQKAIGWALRQYSKCEPEKVQQFIDTHELASLSRREASKYL